MSAGQEDTITGINAPNSENGPVVRPGQPATPAFADNNCLHANPYPNTASPGQDPASARPATSPTSPNQVVIGNVPGNQGTVTEGQ